MTATATLTHAEVLSSMNESRVSERHEQGSFPEKWGALSGKECDWGVS